jgi:asparagine synthase (glutamine-hydrolysing)
MCGINGIYGLKDPAAAKEKIAAMNLCMSHRGPDDQGDFAEEDIALGHRRLSIIDLSSAGHQPMSSYDKRYQIIYNGELYNYRQLKFELQRVVAGSGQSAYFFQTETDTEVIIAAYARWGADCIKYFNGMFAFAIWDREKKELFIARDRLGIKPLYYFFTKGILGFSSEIRSLLASELISRKVDEASLADYLRYQTVHAPDTIIKGIKMLLPGHFLLAKDGDVKIKCYWDLEKNTNSASEGKSYKEVCNDVNSLLTASVERRLIADVPFGAFLSGGIDSSAIVGLMSKVSSTKVKTFSVTFDEQAFSEAKYADMVAKKFDTDHHEIRLRPEDFMKDIPAALSAMDHPSGDGPNTYVVSKATKNAGVTMALSGLGGDELFAGYDIFSRSKAIRSRSFAGYTPVFMRAAAGSLIAALKPGVSSDKLSTFLRSDRMKPEDFYVISRQVLMDRQVKALLQDKHLPENSVARILGKIDFNRPQHLLSAVSKAEISTYMQNVLLRDADQMSMAHALEVRVPFIDYTLVEYVLGIKDEYKGTASPKKLLVDSLDGLLPDELVNRPKMGFTFPWRYWLKNELRDFCQDRILALSKRSHFVEKEVVGLWNAFLKDDPRVTWSRIWYLVVLENWLQQNKIND